MAGAAGAAAAGLPRGRDAELPGPGGDERGRQGHPALPADWGGRQVSFGGRGGRSGRVQSPQLGPLEAFSRPSQGPRAGASILEASASCGVGGSGLEAGGATGLRGLGNANSVCTPQFY